MSDPEITPEMIKAGRDALFRNIRCDESADAENAARAIYRAMQAAQSRPPKLTDWRWDGSIWSWVAFDASGQRYVSADQMTWEPG